MSHAAELELESAANGRVRTAFLCNKWAGSPLYGSERPMEPHAWIKEIKTGWPGTATVTWEP